MNLLEGFYPDELADSVYGIAYESWYTKGYRGLIFDIDNTLVPHGAPADAKAIDLFSNLKKIGFQTMLISNNKEPRVKSFADKVGSPYIFDAGKPGPGAYKQAMERMHTTTGTTLFVGDQLFTDICGAKRLHIPTIRVNPIHPKEEIQIVLKRKLEAIVLYFYRRSRQRT
jgi:HAD superfamily phosphatase (TIGR01668 family)